MSKDSSGDLFAGIARSLSSEHGTTATYEKATAIALDIVDRCDYAGIAVLDGRKEMTTLTATDDKVVTLLHDLQVETGEGPDIDGVADLETIYSADLRTETRWPLWTARVVADTDVRSVLALQLFSDPSRGLGCLNLYSTSPDAFRLEDRVSALALAAHIAVAIAAARGRQSMESALLHRTTIGQAEGMLMQKFDLSPDAAFSALVRLSQASQTKLHQVASDIVRNGIRFDDLH